MRCAAWRGEANRDAALIRQRQQQAHNIALERSTRSKRWRTSLKLHRLAVIDAVSYGVGTGAGEGRSCDPKLSATAAAVYGELHRAPGATARKGGGANDRRVIDRRGGLADDPVAGALRRGILQFHAPRQLIQTFQPLCGGHYGASAKMRQRIGRALRESDPAYEIESDGKGDHSHGDTRDARALRSSHS